LGPADYKDFGTLTEAFETLNIEWTKAHLQRIANTPITLTEAQQEEVDKMLQKIEEDEDVQEVFTNIG
jgi:transcriptional/translational regulatory protein YebC/TACO1